MREKRSVIFGLLHLLRITPASAGKTDKLGVSVNVDQDHPRECGKNFFFLELLLVVSGITPASAGKTWLQIAFCFQLQDHPRECGKNFIKAIL